MINRGALLFRVLRTRKKRSHLRAFGNLVKEVLGDYLYLAILQ